MIPAPREQNQTDTFIMTSLVWKFSVLLRAIDPITIMTVIEPGSKEKYLACPARWKNKTTKTSLVVFVHYGYW